MKKALGLAFVVISLFALPAMAQPEDPGESRAESFQAAQGAQRENVPGGALAIAAYGAVFVLVLGYVVSIGFRQARTARELGALRDELSTRRSEES